MKRIMNIVRFLLVFVVNLYVMAVFHSYISFLFMVGMILFPVYSVIATVYVARSVKLVIIPPRHSVYKGESSMLRFKLINPSSFVLVNAVVRMELSNTFYGEKRQIGLNLPVRAKGESTADWVLDPKCCGHIVVKAVSVQITGLFGIFAKQTFSDAVADFPVLPRGTLPEDRFEHQISRIYSQGAFEEAESRNRGYDFPEADGIREYVQGDKLRDIHWKLSAKQDALMVRERVNVADTQLNIFPDLEDDAERRLESVLELADGVTGALVRRNLPFTVHYYSVNAGELKAFPVANEPERMQWLEQMMYDCHCDGGENAEALFAREYPGKSYLYIGTKRMPGDGQCICGRQQAVAVLRG